MTLSAPSQRVRKENEVENEIISRITIQQSSFFRNYEDNAWMKENHKLFN